MRLIAYSFGLCLFFGAPTLLSSDFSDIRERATRSFKDSDFEKAFDLQLAVLDAVRYLQVVDKAEAQLSTPDANLKNIMQLLIEPFEDNRAVCLVVDNISRIEALFFELTDNIEGDHAEVESRLHSLIFLLREFLNIGVNDDSQLQFELLRALIYGAYCHGDVDKIITELEQYDHTFIDLHLAYAAYLYGSENARPYLNKIAVAVELPAHIEFMEIYHLTSPDLRNPDKILEIFDDASGALK